MNLIINIDEQIFKTDATGKKGENESMELSLSCSTALLASSGQLPQIKIIFLRRRNASLQAAMYGEHDRVPLRINKIRLREEPFQPFP